MAETRLCRALVLRAATGRGCYMQMLDALQTSPPSAASLVAMSSVPT